MLPLSFWKIQNQMPLKRIVQPHQSVLLQVVLEYELIPIQNPARYQSGFVRHHLWSWPYTQFCTAFREPYRPAIGYFHHLDVRPCTIQHPTHSVSSSRAVFHCCSCVLFFEHLNGFEKPVKEALTGPVQSTEHVWECRTS